MSDASAYKEFLAHLKRARKAARLSQAELAASLDRHQTYVSLVERGQRQLDLLEFVKWCQRIKADPAELLTVLTDKVDKPRARVKLDSAPIAPRRRVRLER
ncbi:helix-turn-helix domain-containing protein [Polaromonas sp. YR568]|uniref:helix-turn-helix domain-containing protein n=1 Tax=Polaromonas sp. YR568 TaxID=1855301 RepID=UPI000B810EDD|nr:helix-turn-helix transcriptional regulator [Polaromonas sp. YR568]